MCVLPAAFPTAAPPSDGMLGWRAEVMAKRGSKAKNTYQIKVFGHWFELGDTARIMPVKQLEEQEESGEEEEEEEGEEEEDVPAAGKGR